MDDPLPRFAANLRRLREVRGLTQDAFAQLAGMDAAEIRKLESARRDPGVRVTVRLIRALDASVAELFDGVE